MQGAEQPYVIVMADDDADDQALVRDAAREAGIEARIDCVADGHELIAYLRARADAALRGDAQARTFVLLDLNMPQLDGREALARIRRDERLRHLPVVVFSTSTHAGDVLGSYRAGANSYVVKPSSYVDFVRLMRELADYWFATVRLPPAA
jgi:two-component system response regulator